MVGIDGKAVQTFPQRKQHIQGSNHSATVHGTPPPTRDFFISSVFKDTVDMEFQELITENGLNDFILTLVSNSEA